MTPAVLVALLLAADPDSARVELAAGAGLASVESPAPTTHQNSDRPAAVASFTVSTALGSTFEVGAFAHYMGTRDVKFASTRLETDSPLGTLYLDTTTLEAGPTALVPFYRSSHLSLGLRAELLFGATWTTRIALLRDDTSTYLVYPDSLSFTVGGRASLYVSVPLSPRIGLGLVVGYRLGFAGPVGGTPEALLAASF